MVISNIVFPGTDFFAVNNTLTSDQTTIEPGADISYKAGYQVRLQEGFHAEMGSIFSASISTNCNTLNNFNSAKKQSDSPYNQFETNEIIVYPNPSNGRFTITINSTLKITSRIEFILFDLNGNAISKEYIKPPNSNVIKKQMGFGNLSSGQYLNQLNFDDMSLVEHLTIL